MVWELFVWKILVLVVKNLDLICILMCGVVLVVLSMRVKGCDCEREFYCDYIVWLIRDGGFNDVYWLNLFVKNI